MFTYVARYQGFALIHSLLFLTLISLIVFRFFEFSWMQAQLIQLFYHNVQLWNVAEVDERQ